MRKKIKLIINPSSGRQNIENRIDFLTKLLLDEGYIVAKYFTEKKNDAMDAAMRACKEYWDIIIACGGDGTVNEVVSGIAKSRNKIPIAIFSAGTVNDFANYMKIPTRVPDFVDMIKKENKVDIDLGKLNEKYFINVAAGGLLTSVGYQVAPEAKAILGRLAYYFEGLKEIVMEGLDPVRVNFQSEEYTGEDEILLFLISNTSSIGGFKNLAPDADALDGMMNVLIIKDSDITELANIFFNILRGQHVKHENIVYFKTKSISISTDEDIPIDIDGEYGGSLPAVFQVVPKGIELIVS